MSQIIGKKNFSAKEFNQDTSAVFAFDVNNVVGNLMYFPWNAYNFHDFEDVSSSHNNQIIGKMNFSAKEFNEDTSAVFAFDVNNVLL